ncbi:hypothetical protein ACM66B_002410 [Microbotryomycetes sp. NB124-2]
MAPRDFDPPRARAALQVLDDSLAEWDRSVAQYRPSENLRAEAEQLYELYRAALKQAGADGADFSEQKILQMSWVYATDLEAHHLRIKLSTARTPTAAFEIVSARDTSRA